jgi:hypothetical protein
MFDKLDLTTILHIIAAGFFLNLGWASMSKLWAMLGDRGQLVASIIVLVVILVAAVLAYRGA